MKTPSTKRKKQSSLSIKNGESVNLTASKKVKGNAEMNDTGDPTASNSQPSESIGTQRLNDVNTRNDRLSISGNKISDQDQSSPLHDGADETEHDYSDTSTELVHEDNDDDSDYIYSSGYTSPTPNSKEDPFTEDTKDENIIITNVPLQLTSSKNSEFDLFVNDVNISEKFRIYINKAILHANNKGLYAESHIHEILSLSSILVLIPNSYSTKMVEVFGLQVLESIHREYTPTLSISLDTEIESIYRGAIKTCLRDSRRSAIDSISGIIKGLFTFIDELHILLNIRDILVRSYDVLIDKLQNPGFTPSELESSFKRKTLDTPEFKKLVSKTHCVKRECPLWFGQY